MGHSGATVLFGLALTACFDSKPLPEECIDADGDGYGEGPGCVAPDCDDTTAAIRATCPTRRCVEDPGFHAEVRGHQTELRSIAVQWTCQNQG